MKTLFGWAGKILFVDLSSRNIRVEPTEKYLSFVGGRGINQWLLFNLLDRNIAPLDSDSVMILGAGPMVGTLVPTASRLSIDFKNVLTGGVGSANCGGRFAAEMKFSGYDHIVVTGKSSERIYIYIHGETVHFRNASDIWGKTTWKTDNIIKDREKNQALSTLTIGAGGENLVKLACIMGDKGRAAAYGGGGALMGSKNLKAIAIKGASSPVRIAKPVEFMNRLKKFKSEVFEKSRAVKLHREGGTLGAYLLPRENRPHGVKNMSEAFWSNASLENVTRDKFDEFLVRRHSCAGCPVYCSAIYKIKDRICEGIQANNLRAFGTNVDVKSAEDILYAHALSNDYGLDCDQTSAAVAWAIECYEKGIIDQSDTDGLELRFGDGRCVSELIRKIAFREGFGDILADGVYEASRKVGRGSDELSVVVKKAGVMEAAMRSHKGWALGIVTSTRGAGHLRGSSGLEFQKVPSEASRKFLNIDDISDPTSYDNKAELVVWQEKYKGITDMMGICALTSMWMDIHLFTPEDIAGLLNDITGKNYSAEELLNIGEQLQNLEKCFNLLHAGFERSDDMPPGKLMDIPVERGMYEGEKIDIEKWNQMVDRYYELHGWDRESGYPTKKRLLSLDLGVALDMLVENNIEMPE
jgi:aldehyde:ferredoxin oxidoreductase